jgi:hypothetical protein
MCVSRDKECVQSFGEETSSEGPACMVMRFNSSNILKAAYDERVRYSYLHPNCRPTDDISGSDGEENTVRHQTKKKSHKLK